MRLPKYVYRLTLAGAAFFATGCGGGTTPDTVGYSIANLQTSGNPSPAFKKPALIAFDSYTDALEYWPIAPNGGSQPQQLSASLGIDSGYGLVANGNVVAIASFSPAEIVTYNVRTKAQTSLADPYGGPLDIAIDKQGTLYALNLGSVAVFKPGSSQPTQLTCSYIDEGEAIAVDDERDVFVDGYGPHGFMGVVEYAAGSQGCTKPHLRPQHGYVGGVGVDPRTDDLIVVDNPGVCAGGLEGLMIIYPKPYEPRTSHRHNLGANYCAGTFRLNSTSSLIFVSDATVSDGFPLIDQATYPEGKSMGYYQSSPSGYSGSFGGFTTIPNTLPN